MSSELTPALDALLNVYLSFSRIFPVPSLGPHLLRLPSMPIRARLPASPSTSRAPLWPQPLRKGLSSASLTHRPRRSSWSSGEGLTQLPCTGENSLCLNETLVVTLRWLPRDHFSKYVRGTPYMNTYSSTVLLLNYCSVFIKQKRCTCWSLQLEKSSWIRAHVEGMDSSNFSLSVFVL